MNLTPAQIQFNPWKHHLGFVSGEILRAATATEERKKEILKIVKSINANFVDVYTGQYSPLQLQELVARELGNRNIFSLQDLTQWLGVKGFQLLSLNDQSIWVIRKSEYKEALVHIHPSRTPPLAFRIHGNAWKTALLMAMEQPEYLKGLPTLREINNFRKEHLNLSPVKGNENLQRLMKAYELILSGIAWISPV